MCTPDAEIKYAGQLIHFLYCPPPNWRSKRPDDIAPFLSVIMNSPVLNHLRQLKPSDLVNDSLPFVNWTTSYEGVSLISWQTSRKWTFLVF
jgi:hypothetical protein